MNSLWQIWVVVEWLSGKWKPGFDSRLIGVDRDRTWRLSFSFTSSIVFFFLTLLHRVSRQFQIGSDFSWHCLIVCVTIWLLLKRTKRRHRRCGWVTDSFCLEHIDRKVRFRHTKKAKKKSKIKLASSRYIVFSNQAEINQVKTDRTKISTQPDTSLCMQ